ncbi:hypothetical protein IFM89_024542, partial [Coptis chinensis]
EINDSPIEQVRLTVPITDDSALPALTFRTWVLGPISCICIAFAVQFFSYRQNMVNFSQTYDRLRAGWNFYGISCKISLHVVAMSLLDVSFYRILHEKEERQKGYLTKLQFFVIVAVSSFAYYVLPNYFFPSITALSFVCWIWKNSVVAQQIGSGLHGFGIGSFALDWPTITGQDYNSSQVLGGDLKLNEEAYSSYSSIYLSVFFIYGFGFSFGAVTATVTDFVLRYGRETWQQFCEAFKNRKQHGDVHNRLMMKYESIPHWWIYIIFVSMIIVAIINSRVYEEQIQLPYWGILFGCLLAFILILPTGVLIATTGQVRNDTRNNFTYTKEF